MKAHPETKRLFVGGLGQSISEADLHNQFSRFGEVSEVEIITRKDDQGKLQSFVGKGRSNSRQLSQNKGTAEMTVSPCVSLYTPRRALEV